MGKSLEHARDNGQNNGSPSIIEGNGRPNIINELGILHTDPKTGRTFRRMPVDDFFREIERRDPDTAAVWEQTSNPTTEVGESRNDKVFYRHPLR